MFCNLSIEQTLKNWVFFREIASKISQSLFSEMEFSLQFCKLDFPECVFCDGIFTAISQKYFSFCFRIYFSTYFYISYFHLYFQLLFPKCYYLFPSITWRWLRASLFSSMGVKFLNGGHTLITSSIGCSL